jgi:hypothetical protein
MSNPISAKVEKWGQQSEALQLKQLTISLDGFDPDAMLLPGVVKGQKQVMIKGHPYDDIDLYNGDYAFGQFTVPIDTTYGEAAKYIDMIMQASVEDERKLFLELITYAGEDAVSRGVFFTVFLGS